MSQERKGHSFRDEDISQGFNKERFTRHCPTTTFSGEVVGGDNLPSARKIVERSKECKREFDWGAIRKRIWKYYHDRDL